MVVFGGDGKTRWWYWVFLFIELEISTYPWPVHVYFWNAEHIKWMIHNPVTKTPIHWIVCFPCIQTRIPSRVSSYLFKYFQTIRAFFFWKSGYLIYTKFTIKFLETQIKDESSFILDIETFHLMLVSSERWCVSIPLTLARKGMFWKTQRLGS